MEETVDQLFFAVDLGGANYFKGILRLANLAAADCQAFCDPGWSNRVRGVGEIQFCNLQRFGWEPLWLPLGREKHASLACRSEARLGVSQLPWFSETNLARCYFRTSTRSSPAKKNVTIEQQLGTKGVKSGRLRR